MSKKKKKERTAGELLTLYLETRFLRPTSVVSVKQLVRMFGPNTHVNFDTIMEFVHRRIATGVSKHTIRGELGRLRSLWRCGYQHGVMPYVPTIPTPRVPKVIITTTPREVVHELMKECRRLRGNIPHKGPERIPRKLFWTAFVAVLYDTGLRTSDVLQLRWEDGKTTWTIHQRKTGNPKLVRPNPETLYWMGQLGRIYPRLFDVGWTRTSYCAGLRRIAAGIGLHITPQQLRRTSISEVERAHPGAGPWHAGHTSDGTTRRWYFDHEHIFGDVTGPTIEKPKSAKADDGRGDDSDSNITNE